MVGDVLMLPVLTELSGEKSERMMDSLCKFCLRTRGTRGQ